MGLPCKCSQGSSGETRQVPQVAQDESPDADSDLRRGITYTDRGRIHSHLVMGAQRPLQFLLFKGELDS